MCTSCVLNARARQPACLACSQLRLPGHHCQGGSAEPERGCNPRRGIKGLHAVYGVKGGLRPQLGCRERVCMHGLLAAAS